MRTSLDTRSATRRACRQRRTSVPVGRASIEGGGAAPIVHRLRLDRSPWAMAISGKRGPGRRRRLAFPLLPCTATKTVGLCANLDILAEFRIAYPQPRTNAPDVSACPWDGVELAEFASQSCFGAWLVVRHWTCPFFILSSIDSESEFRLPTVGEHVETTCGDSCSCRRSASDYLRSRSIDTFENHHLVFENGGTSWERSRSQTSRSLSATSELCID